MISGHTRVFEGEEFTCMGKACLNFAEDQQNAVFLSHFTDALQPPAGAGFTPPSP
jgi:hypothetical protein